MHGCRDEEDLVVGLDDGIALGLDRAILAVDGRDACLDLRHVLVQCPQLVPDQRPAVISLDRDEPDASAGEIEHLQGARILDQTQDVLGDQCLGADRKIDRQGVGAEQLGLIEEALRPHAGDLGGRMEEGVGDLTGDHVGLVAVGDRNDHVGVFRAGTPQHVGVCAVAEDGAQIEAVLQLSEQLRNLVDDGDVVGLADQIRGHRGADLAGTEDDDLH